MCNIRFEELELDHVVEFAKDSTVFVAARENISGRVRLFLIHNNTGNVYARNGKVDSWEQLFGSSRENILARLVAAREGRTVPTYKINGSHN